MYKTRHFENAYACKYWVSNYVPSSVTWILSHLYTKLSEVLLFPLQLVRYPGPWPKGLSYPYLNLAVYYLRQWNLKYLTNTRAYLSGRAVYGVGLWLLPCYDRGFETRRRHGRLSLVIVVCCQVEVSLRRADHPSRRVLTNCGVFMFALCINDN